MSQGVEGYVGVPPNVPGGQSVRQLQFQIAQPQPAGGTEGSTQAVLVEVVALCDSDTGNPITPLTKDQGDQIISLLERLIKSTEAQEDNHNAGD